MRSYPVEIGQWMYLCERSKNGIESQPVTVTRITPVEIEVSLMRNPQTRVFLRRLNGTTGDRSEPGFKWLEAEGEVIREYRE
jgi:hypothetical protein